MDRIGRHDRRYQKHIVNETQRAYRPNTLQVPLYSLLDITSMVNKELKLFTCRCHICFLLTLAVDPL